MPATVAQIAGVINELDRPPILMGHSFGGTLTQLLLDRGCGAVGVAIDSAPTEGVHVVPLSQIKSFLPNLESPANRHKAVGFTPEEFRYAFTNTLSEEESRKVYDRYHIPAPGNWVWAGGEDHIMAPSVNESNAKHYKGDTVTAYHEFPGRSHWTCGEPGWEEVADFALDWAVEHAGTRPVTASA